MASCILAFILLASLGVSSGVQNARLSVASPQGLRITVPDVSGASLVAVHYTVNSPISGVNPGKWNYDIRSKTGGQWVHENRNVRLNNGDTVYYWLYMLVNGRGRQVTGQNWKVSGVSSSGGSGRPTEPVTSRPSNPQPSNPNPPVSSGGDSTWNGRKLRLVFEDNFSGSAVDTAKWEHEVSLWGGGNWEFQAYTNLPQNSYTRNGALYIKPTATADKYGEAWLTSGRWDVKQMYGTCTMEAVYGCLREGKSGYLNPIMSAKLRTRKGIRYGKVEIVAKMPRGDWIWPALWMLPNHGSRNGGGSYGGWPKSGEIDIMESRGNRHYGNLGVEHMGSTLHWGTQHVNKYALTTAHKKISSKTLADGYHRYTFYWDQNGMDFYLDNDKVARFATPSQGFFRWGNLPGANIWSHANNAPFDKEFYLIMNVAVGGTNSFFPDGISNAGYSKPWSNQDRNAPEKFWNAKNLWQPTWQGDDAAMIVDSVKMWQLE